MCGVNTFYTTERMNLIDMQIIRTVCVDDRVSMLVYIITFTTR